MTETTTVPSGARIPDPNGERTAPFRWRVANRPDVRFGHAAGGVAGVLAAAAIVGFIVDVTGDDATLPGVGFNLLLIAAALAVGIWVRGPVRSAAVAAIAVAVPQVWLFAVVGDVGDVGRDDVRLVLLMSVGTYLGFYLLTWTRGRAVYLGLALLLAGTWVVFEIASQDVPFNAEIVIPGNGLDVQPGTSLGTDDDTTESAVASLLVAAVLLGAGVGLDRRGRLGAATPCLLVGGVFAVSAALTFGTDVDDVYAGGVFVAIAGIAIGLAGSLGRRRGTSWIAALVLLAGVVTVVGQGTADTIRGDGSAAVFGAFALVGAAVLLALGVLVARLLREPVDGGEPFTPRPPKPPADVVPVGAPPPPPPSPSPSPPPSPPASEAPTVPLPAQAPTPAPPEAPPPPPEPTEELAAPPPPPPPPPPPTAPTAPTGPTEAAQPTPDTIEGTTPDDGALPASEGDESPKPDEGQPPPA